MRKTELRELVGNRDFISGIYNYCDRWCERCPFTARCLAYATEKADDDLADPEAHDINNAKFWSRLESIFQEAHEIIMEWAEEAGIDLETIEAEATSADREQRRHDAKQHNLSLSARRYAEMVQQWLGEEFAVEAQVHDDQPGTPKSAAEDIDVSDAVEVIRWYQFFVAVKLFRALMASENDLAEEESSSDEIFAAAGIDDEHGLIEAFGSDSDGSAKIALIAIDRSSSAWRVMQDALPEKADSIVPLLLELERLRRAAEQAFPHARDFIRPGFDEVISDFVS